MEKVYYDLVYLAACGVNQVKPAKECLTSYERKRKSGEGEPDSEMQIIDENVRNLYRFSCRHFLEALVGMTLKEAGVALPKKWEERILKAVRRVLLFDVERERLLSYMESSGIWYLPLKGIVMKDYYPAVGMRQMSDNDILFDATYAEELKNHMASQGYEVASFGQGNHDVYKKPPVYNFEMHRSLYGKAHQEGWEEYYRNVRERLILNEGSCCGYHMSREDFYIYILSHAYKHYQGGGTGIRSLLDFYVYLQKEEGRLDFSYIEKECRALGIAEFEKNSRQLCKKVFSAETAASYDAEAFEEKLSDKEKEMLLYYLTSGVYGTFDRMIEHNMEKYRDKNGEVSKIQYMKHRFFPEEKFLKEYYPFFYRHKWLCPVLWLYRIARGLADSERRKNLFREFKTVRKSKHKDSSAM